MKKIVISMVIIAGIMITGCSSSKESVQKQEESKAIYCNDCGKESIEVTKYCSECGVEAKWVAEKTEVKEDEGEEKKEEIAKDEVVVKQETVVKDEVYVEKPKFTEEKALQMFINHYGQAPDGYEYVTKGINVENGKTYCTLIVGPPNAGGWSYKVFEDGVIVENVIMEDGVEIVN